MKNALVKQFLNSVNGVEPLPGELAREALSEPLSIEYKAERGSSPIRLNISPAITVMGGPERAMRPWQWFAVGAAVACLIWAAFLCV